MEGALLATVTCRKQETCRLWLPGNMPLNLVGCGGQGVADCAAAEATDASGGGGCTLMLCSGRVTLLSNLRYVLSSFLEGFFAG